MSVWLRECVSVWVRECLSVWTYVKGVVTHRCPDIAKTPVTPYWIGKTDGNRSGSIEIQSSLFSIWLSVCCMCVVCQLTFRKCFVLFHVQQTPPRIHFVWLCLLYQSAKVWQANLFSMYALKSRHRKANVKRAPHELTGPVLCNDLRILVVEAVCPGNI